MPTPDSVHVPVLLPDVLSNLNLQPGDTVIDATLGGGGHTRALLEAIAPDGRVLALEADPRTLADTQAKLADAGSRLVIVQKNFRELQTVAKAHGFHGVAAVLFDLGLSSIGLADASRGFSFQVDGPLDMRFDPAQDLTAAEIVNTWSRDDLLHILREYGEERQAERIVDQLILQRQTAPFQTTLALAEAIMTVKPRRGRLHPATQTFQALRMAVNDELAALEEALPQAFDCLRSGGRLAVITFHSIEDRVVKHWTHQLADRGLAELVNKHVIQASYQAAKENPRARSAKLRIIQKK